MLVQDIKNEKDLHDYIASFIDKGRRSSLRTAFSNSSILKSLLIKFTKDEDKANYTERASLIYYGLKERPICKVCRKNKTNFDQNKWKFMDCCSVKCAANDKDRNQKISDTVQEKYGASNFYKTEKFKLMMKTLYTEKYGKEFYMQTDEFKEKSKLASNIHYGHDFPNQSEIIKTKIRDTCISRYGTTNWYQSIDCKERIFNRYRVYHCMQVPEIFDRQQRSSSYKKEYFFPSKKRIVIQGYENKALDFLLQTYDETDIYAGETVFPKIGCIHYEYKGNKKRYFPDIFIESENLIIEVKSTWTLKLHYDLNQDKMKACKDAGYRFQFWVYGKTLEIIEC